jgi:four helix bundle protein
MSEDRWRKLAVWQLADELALQVYQLTSGFPGSERYGLTSQMRRSALSVPTNIVEGYSRRGGRELAHFLNIAYGSLAELKYLVHFASRLEYLGKEDAGVLAHRCDSLGKQLWSFYDKVKNS